MICLSDYSKYGKSVGVEFNTNVKKVNYLATKSVEDKRQQTWRAAAESSGRATRASSSLKSTVPKPKAV